MTFYFFSSETDSSVEYIATEYPLEDNDGKASEEIQATTNSLKTPPIKQYEFNYHKLSDMYKSKLNPCRKILFCREPLDGDGKDVTEASPRV